MIKEVSSDREVNNRVYSLVHLMYLPDSSHLPPPTADRLLYHYNVLLRTHMFIFCCHKAKVKYYCFIGCHNLILHIVSLNQGFHPLTFPTLTWWIKPGSLAGTSRVALTSKTSSATSHHAASLTARASPCPGFWWMITVLWACCTLCQSTEAEVMPKPWSTPLSGDSTLRATQCTAS